MGKSLIITEKPSVAREFAAVLHVNGRQDGYIENDDYCISWCVGHLVGMVYPEEYDMKYKNWKLEDLPFLPKDYKYDVIKNVEKQYNIVHGLLHREDIDRVYWAGDAGKEGQTIEENIRNFGGVREGMEELRVWIDSQTEEEILRGIREARPMSDYANLGMSGIMRTIEDYAMGINFSRALSVKYGRLINDAAATSSYTAIAVGRVMTCVLGMVVIREREIRNFVETPFYRILGSFTDANVVGEWKAVEGSKYFESPLLYKENGFKAEESAQALIDELNGKTAIVESIDKSTSRKKAPLLFNLAELQAECAKRFKISPDETLNVAQSLYEKKLTTYPRTDARVLSTAIAGEIGKNISRLKGYEPTSVFCEKIMAEGMHRNIAKTQYTDDSKVTDHYAIIPTGQLTELRSLNELEKMVFDLIVRRFLSVFYPPAEYENVKLTVKVEGESFFASSKVLKSPGYLEIAGIPKQKKSVRDGNERVMGAYDDKDGEDEEDFADPKALLALAETLKKGDEISVKGYSIGYGKTSPPKRYTSGSMVLAMENAGQLIEDEELRAQIKGSGIGTSATRAEIIQKLVRVGYLNLNKKTQVLTPENLGEMIYEVVDMTVPVLLNPKMTASWEKGLDGITHGTVDFWDYRNKLEEFIRTETLKMIGADLFTDIRDRVSYFAGKDAKGVRRNLGIPCPLCSEGEIVTTPFGYGCSKYNKDKTGCNFTISEIAGVNLSDNQVKELVENKETGVIKGFKSKSGKKFDARLIFKVNSDFNNPFESKENSESEEASKRPYEISFAFESSEPEILEGVSCPWCGGSIKKTSFGFGCANYSKEDENSCHFSVGEIAGKSISEKEFRQLLADKKTDTIRGFKGKSGKKFDACLVLQPDESGKEQVVFDFDNVEAKIVKDVNCPICGGEIRVTSFGYGCSNYAKDDPNSCKFSVGKLLGKSLTETQVRQLITEGRTETIRGFKSKAGKKFDARVALTKNEDGVVSGIKFDFDDIAPQVLKDVVCPKCMGQIMITPWGYSCINNKRNEEESTCDFRIGQIASVKLNQSQVTELLMRKKTGVIDGFVAKTGMKFSAPLKLDENGNVSFDFPEKPKPVDSEIPCPKCEKLMKRGPWQYECECGFKFWHTVGKLALSEVVIKELLSEKRTKKKIVGFTSKAGNVFDTCLKWEDNQIRFDFESTGDGLMNEKGEPVERKEVTETTAFEPMNPSIHENEAHKNEEQE